MVYVSQHASHTVIGCLDLLNAVYQCYLKWVLRLECETHMTCRLSSPCVGQMHLIKQKVWSKGENKD